MIAIVIPHNFAIFLYCLHLVLSIIDPYEATLIELAAGRLERPLRKMFVLGRFSLDVQILDELAAQADVRFLAFFWFVLDDFGL